MRQCGPETSVGRLGEPPEVTKVLRVVVALVEDLLASAPLDLEFSSFRSGEDMV